MGTPSLSYEQWVAEEVRAGDKILDAGCGSGEFGTVEEILETPLDLVGVDIDRESLKRNHRYDHCICATVDSLPLKNGLFHLVVSRFVFEHLEDPFNTFREMLRVLELGGSMIILTQNIWNPLMFLSSILPLSIRKWVTRRLFSEKEDEGRYQTYYRCNRRKKFESLEKGNEGVRMVDFYRFNGTTLHLWKSPLLKALFSVVEWFLSLRVLALFRTSLIVKFKKCP
jgi:ubiquinone/menaquinone biosynthesis C-methylase UbiE